MKRAKSVFTGIALLVWLAPCSGLAADSPTEAVRKLVEEVWSKGNLQLAYQLVSPEYQFHNPMIRIVGPTGPDLVSSMIESRRGAFPDLTFEILDLFAEGQKVAVRWNARGTHEGQLGDAKPTHKEVFWEGISIFHLAGGQIISEWTVDGFASVLRQLGVTQMRVRQQN